MNTGQKDTKDPAKVAQGRRNKRKGSEREYKTRNRLKLLGYRVMRAAGSMGVFDIVAVNHIHWLCVQVKSNRFASPIEREDLRRIKGELPPNTDIEWWMWQDRARMPIIKRNGEIWSEL